jgi:autotransporter-associated beta strand protein
MRSNISWRTVLVLAALAVVALFGGTAKAAVYTWDGSADTNWGTSTNWVGDPTLTWNGTTGVIFCAESAGRRTNITGSDRAIGSMEFNGYADTQFKIEFKNPNGAGKTLTLGDATHAPTITVQESGNVTHILGNVWDADYGNGNIVLANNLTVTNNGSATNGTKLSIDAPIGGTGYGITKEGTGLLTLKAANTYTGNTTVNLGTLVIGGAGRLGSGAYAAGVSIISGATLNYNSTADQGLSGTVANGGSLVKDNTGTLTLSGANSGDGTTAVNRGVLRLANASALGGWALNVSGGAVELAAGDFQRDLGAGAGQVQVGAGTSGFSAYGADRTVTLGTAGSTLTWGSADFAPTSLLLNAATANAKLTLDNAIDLNGSTRTIAVDANTAEIPGEVSGTGAGLTKTGAGKLVLSGNNTYTGLTTVSAGTLVLSGNNVDAIGGTTIDGGAVQFESAAAINGTGQTVTINAGGAVVFGVSFGAANVHTALSDRIVAGSAGVIAADNYGDESFNFDTLDFTNAYLGAVGSVTYTGTLTPSGTTGSAVYRLGGGGGMLTMADANAITGTGNSLVVNGNVTLAGANDYTGTTTVNAGKLILSGSNSTSGVTVNGGTLAVGSDGAIGSGALAINGGAIDAANGSTTLSTNNPVTIGGNFAFGGSDDLNLGTGAVTNAGSRTITLNGTNSTLTLGGVMTNTSGAVQTTTVNGAGNTLVLGGYALSHNATNLVDVITGTGNVTITGAVTDGTGGATACGLTKSGAGVLALSGTNTYSGATSSNQGTIVFQGKQAVSPNTAITLNHTSGSSGGVKLLDDASGTISLPNTFKAYTNNATGNHAFFVGNNNTANGGSSSGTTTGSTFEIANLVFSYAKSDTSNQTINVTGANGYRIQFDSVTLNNLAGRTAGSTTDSVFNPTTASITLGSVTMASGNNKKGIPNLKLDGTTSDNYITGIISDASDAGTTGRPLPVSKTNSSTWTLSGTNTYTGVTTVSGGVLVLNDANALPGGIGSTGGTNALTFNTNGVLGLGAGDFNRPLAAAGTADGVNFTGNGGWAAYNADRVVNLNNDSHQIVWGATDGTGFNAKTLILGASTATNTVDLRNPLDLGAAVRTVQVDDSAAAVDGKLSGVLSGAGGGLTKTGNGTLALTNAASSYTGVTTVSAGVLVVSKLDNGDSNSSIGASTNADTNLLLANGTTLKYVGAEDSTDRRFKINGTAAGHGATLDASGTGPINFTNATGPTYGSTSQTRTLNLIGGNTGDNTLAAGIGNNGSGKVSVVKDGAGKWILSGASSYTGNTTVNQGTLLVNGSLNAGSAVTVKNTGTLGGTGTIGGAITVEAGGILAPGASAGTLKDNTSVKMMANSIYNWEFDSPTAADKVVITGSLQLDTDWKLSLGGAGTPAAGSEYDIFTYTTGFTGTIDGNIIFSPAGWPIAKIGKDESGATKRIYLKFGQPGDTNNDGVVDAADYLAVKQNLGLGSGATLAQGNVDDDGDVDWDDLQIVMTNFGGGAGTTPATTPEPATLFVMMAAGLPALLKRRRRRS